MTYLNLEEAAKLFPSKPSTQALRRRIANGSLKAVKDGGYWYTTKEWIEDYLDRHKIRAPAFNPRSHQPATDDGNNLAALRRLGVRV